MNTLNRLRGSALCLLFLSALVLSACGGGGGSGGGSGSSSSAPTSLLIWRNGGSGPLFQTPAWCTGNSGGHQVSLDTMTTSVGETASLRMDPADQDFAPGTMLFTFDAPTDMEDFREGFIRFNLRSAPGSLMRIGIDVVRTAGDGRFGCVPTTSFGRLEQYGYIPDGTFKPVAVSVKALHFGQGLEDTFRVLIADNYSNGVDRTWWIDNIRWTRD